jgi:hypothetical protein
MTSPEEADRLFELGDECSAKGARARQEGNAEEGRRWFLEAIDAYRVALKEAPPDDVLLVGNLKLCIGARQIGLGELDHALATCEEVIGELAARPDLISEGEGADLNAQARLNRAECRLIAGDVAAAQTEIHEVLAEFPEHPYGTVLKARLGS